MMTPGWGQTGQPVSFEILTGPSTMMLEFIPSAASARNDDKKDGESDAWAFAVVNESFSSGLQLRVTLRKVIAMVEPWVPLMASNVAVVLWLEMTMRLMATGPPPLTAA